MRTRKSVEVTEIACDHGFTEYTTLFVRTTAAGFDVELRRHECTPSLGRGKLFERRPWWYEDNNIAANDDGP